MSEEHAQRMQESRIHSEDEVMSSAASSDFEMCQEFESESGSGTDDDRKEESEREKSAGEDWNVTEYQTPLPPDTWAPTPAQRGSWRPESESGESSESESEGFECFTGDRSHVYPNEVVMKTVRKKRKPTSPVAQEPKHARGEGGRALRSKGLELAEQPLPSRPLEWKQTKPRSTAQQEKHELCSLSTSPPRGDQRRRRGREQGVQKGGKFGPLHSSGVRHLDRRDSGPDLRREPLQDASSIVCVKFIYIFM